MLHVAERWSREWRAFDNASAEVTNRVVVAPLGTVTATTETALFTTQTFGKGAAGDGQGGFWSQGQRLRITLEGLLTTIGTAGTITMNWRLDTNAGATLGVSIAITPVVSITKAPWSFEGMVTCRSIGTAGALYGMGKISFGSTVVTTTSPGRVFYMPDITADATTAIDTTADHSIVFTVLQTQAHTWIPQGGSVEVMR